MKIQVTKKQELTTTLWSGGTTTELYIAPKAASYSARNFNVRVSTATVDCEKSIFTPLPGYTRKLMILDGQIIISHKNRYSTKLLPGQIELFDGGWETSSNGRCVDFNVMTKGKQSRLFQKHLDVNTDFELVPQFSCSVLVIYVHSGMILIQEPKNNTTITTGDVIICKQDDLVGLSIRSKDEAILVITEITDSELN